MAVFQVVLKFRGDRQKYRFLFLHVPDKGYYSTGTTPDNGYFPTWEALWDYLDSDEVEERGALLYMRPSAPVRNIPVKTGWS